MVFLTLILGEKLFCIFFNWALKSIKRSIIYAQCSDKGWAGSSRSHWEYDNTLYLKWTKKNIENHG